MLSLNTQPKPLLQQYQPVQAKPLSRKEADRVWSLPGITYELNFKQYSGYLKGVPGNYLHYWLVESQNKPSSDPLVLWLNGGPGCSSLGGMLTELGPFRPNPDGRTLYENVYAWNKGANVLFLEGPRNVGFSYQNKSENGDPSYNDKKTAHDNFLAIMDFLSAYPEYQNRPFYVTGESYGGVYVPTLTSLLIDMIQGGQAPGLNLVGMAVGNGELSALQQINSAVSLLYYHGMYGKQEFDSLSDCCADKSQPLAYCDFSQWIRLDSAGNAVPLNNSDCANKVAYYGQIGVWGNSQIQDVYNMYQDCYQQKAVIFGSRNMQRQRQHFSQKVSAPFVDQKTKLNLASTDNQGAYPCFASNAAQQWLNSDDVRAALHIPPQVQPWTDCNDDINAQYIQQHNDTSAVFDHIVKSKYKLRVLVYNGDVDTACNFLGDEWFVEALATRFAMSESSKRSPWNYQQQIAGYWKRFSYQNTFTVDLLTVKGGGHLVPTDRPGPALQMINNFIAQSDYTAPSPFSSNQTPLKQQYQIASQLSSSASVLRSRMKRSSMSSEASESKHGQHLVSDPPSGSKASDKIASLPGVTFPVNFQQYSGYLNASAGNFLHYWLVESQGKPSTDPLILWLNGGPGCSSLGGLMTELGPFHPNPDGQTLFENQFSWNKVGNVLFLESPRDVGFSYRSKSASNDSLYNDDKTASDNVLALQSFFARFPEYKNRDFYITGESYGGVYVPTFTDLLIKQIQNKAMAYVNLKGIAIGNGEISEVQQINSAPDLLYYRGVFGKREYDQLKPCCVSKSGAFDNYCDFSQYITLDVAGNAHAIPSADPVRATCGKLIEDMAFHKIWETANDVYNTYQDCYVPNGPPARRTKRYAYSSSGLPLTNNFTFVNQASRLNYRSTDASGGFPCYMDDATAMYLNTPAVKEALHIPAGLPAWQDCNDPMNAAYIQQHNDTTSVFESIIASNYPLRVLIYNGDVDAACNFLGDEWFIERLTSRHAMNATKRAYWQYSQAAEFLPRIGGYVKTFSMPNVKIDLLTVKGAGHFVPLDRPGPALQMISNFVNNQNYSTMAPYNTTAQPLINQFKATPVPLVPRMKADKVFDLPGLTYNVNFNQHSGYLKSSPGNYLHYWFVESQGNVSTDPVILWLNGGPGCSSVGGLLSELGPFHPNSDGRTLFENVYSWNKAANILFLEAPRGVGFSYQDTDVNPDPGWDDTKTAEDTSLALADFFSIYDQFRDHDFYIAGESYAGVYVPTLTALVIDKIQSGQLDLNLVGMIVGNGELSAIQDIRSTPDFMYFHGIYGKDEWDQLKQCCKPADGLPTTVCYYDKFVTIDQWGDVIGIDHSSPLIQKCGQLVQNLAQTRVWYTANDVYNLYQDCYQQTSSVFGSAVSKNSGRMKTREEIHASVASSNGNVRSAYSSVMGSVNSVSTDATGGFQCYMTNAITQYLNQSHVRDALHIPDYVQQWAFCSDPVGSNYTQEHNDTSAVFQHIMDSGYNLRMLIYNGDADTACSIFEAEWFVEQLAADNKMNSSKRSEWYYQLAPQYNQVIGGYQKSFSKGSVSIDLLTVKGAGHFVPTDRPGPSLQMVTNFIRKTGNYSAMAPFSLDRQPLLPQYQSSGSQTTTTQATEPPITQSQTGTATSAGTSAGSNIQTTVTPTPTPQNGSDPLRFSFAVLLLLLSAWNY